MTILQSQDSFSGLGLSSSPKASTRFSAEYNSLSSRYPLFLGASLSINSYTGSLLNAYGSGDLKMTYFEALAHGDYVWVRRGRILFASGVAAGFANLRIQQSFSTRAGESAGNNALDFRLENVFLTHLRGYWYLKFQLGYSFLNFNEVPAIVNLVQGTKDFNLSGVFGGVGVSYAF